MGEQILRGLPASPGLAAGPARVLDVRVADTDGTLADELRAGAAEAALSALVAAADEIAAVAEGLRREGNDAEAEIIETGVLMAADPGLVDAVRAAVLDEGVGSAQAILQAADRYGDALAALDDELLRQRADDVRSLGRRAARIATSQAALTGSGFPSGAVGGGSNGAPANDYILVARELGPADVAEYAASARGIALAAGGTMAHGAIVARSLGIPMVVGAGEALLDVNAGAPLVVDGSAGEVTLVPSGARRRRAQVAAAERVRARERTAAARALPAQTLDGRRIRVLVNVASAAELSVGLGAGAQGVGLLRTELRFLEASGWPSEDEHRRQLAPVLAGLAGRTATVRLLDFGGDKTPPFLGGTRERGIGLLLEHPGALEAQLRAIAVAGEHTDLRVLLPMVESAEQVEAVRAAARRVTGRELALGAMIETRDASFDAPAIAAAADFLSIGTNDLTHSVLASDRFAPGTAVAHDPAVLAAVARTVEAAAGAGRIVEVCGEAAGDPLTMPLLLGLGVDELSVGAARVGSVRAWARELDYDGMRALSMCTLELADAGEVAELMQPVAELLGQFGDVGAQAVESGVGVVAIGGQP
jgi:phosphoenolpyruvate-protein kinase (PTS system EI component)